MKAMIIFLDQGFSFRFVGIFFFPTAPTAHREQHHADNPQANARQNRKHEKPKGRSYLELKLLVDYASQFIRDEKINGDTREAATADGRWIVAILGHLFYEL